jgi:ribosomal protein L7Ae-like RNA K-turn-binding protein
MLGFALRARKLSIGMTATIAALKKKQLELVILAEDISENGYRKIKYATEETGVEVCRTGTKSELGQFLNRAEVGVLGIKCANFSKSIKNILNKI